MKEKLKKHFLAFGPRRFVYFAFVMFLALDLVGGYYLTLWWEVRNMSQLLVGLAMRLQNVGADLTPDTIRELEGLTDRLFDFFLLIVLVNNVFFYVNYLRKRLWAQGYLLFYALTASIMNVTYLFEGNVLGWNWFAINVATIFVYLYLYLGVKLLKEETTIPARGKTGR